MSSSPFFLRMFGHLLPRSPTWLLSVLTKPLRMFLDGLTGLPDDIRIDADKRFLDMIPATTQQLFEWDAQFGLPNAEIDEATQRSRLTSAWRRSGGQSLHYLNSILAESGFDVTVHPWWEPDQNNDIADVEVPFFGPSIEHSGDTDVGAFGDTWDEATVGVGNQLASATQHMLLRFALDIPRGSRILRAKLVMTQANVSSGVLGLDSNVINVGRLKRIGPWDQFGFGPGFYPTVADYLPLLPTGFSEDDKDNLINGSLADDDWIGQVQFFESTWTDGQSLTIGDTLFSDVTVPLLGLTAAVQREIDGGSYLPKSESDRRCGFGLVFDTKLNDRLWNFYSSEELVENTPILLVEYEEPAVQPLTVKNPNIYIENTEDPNDATCCGEALMECNEAIAECGETIGKRGYLLVNKIDTATTIHLGCGDPLMQCGEVKASCGEPLSLVFGRVPYTIPVDADRRRHFLYVAGLVWPENAKVNATRKVELENLVLSLRPGDKWLGIMVDFAEPKQPFTPPPIQVP